MPQLAPLFWVGFVFIGVMVVLMMGLLDSMNLGKVYFNELRFFKGFNLVW